MSTLTTIRYANAVTQALHDCMTEDESVIIMGEDVAAAGGSFKATKGLLVEFGPERVIDTPISESSITSAAVGAALSGLKPVVEIMFMDFITLSMDALVNQAAKARYMFGAQGSVPMVLRTPHGGGLSAGPQHSQCLEAWFAHIPGLKVVCPSSPQDAYSLLKAAINDPDPVVFIEHKAMYGTKGEVDTNITAKIGEAKIVRSGTDVTLVTYGLTVNVCMKAAEKISASGIEVEVIDLRSLQPWDKETVLESLSRTHRVVVVHEAVESFGPGAEIVATLANEGFDELDAPILRVAAPFMPAPFASSLEKGYVVTVERILEAIQKVMV